jgi:hypothetical protein
MSGVLPPTCSTNGTKFLIRERVYQFWKPPKLYLGHIRPKLNSLHPTELWPEGFQDLFWPGGDGVRNASQVEVFGGLFSRPYHGGKSLSAGELSLKDAPCLRMSAESANDKNRRRRQASYLRLNTIPSLPFHPILPTNPSPSKPPDSSGHLQDCR